MATKKKLKKSEIVSKIISQCPKCQRVQTKQNDGRIYSQESICEFPVEKKLCFIHEKEHVDNFVDTMNN